MSTKDSIKTAIKVFALSDSKLRPHLWITGPSGSGKTHLVSNLSSQSGLEYFEINAAQLTKEGTSGNSLSKALSPLKKLKGKPAICFVDEADKLFISGNDNNSRINESAVGVQNEFLRVLEASSTEVFGEYGKYDNVRCDNVLFIFAGAFNNEEGIDLNRLQALGVKTEFLGRVSLIYNLEKLELGEIINLVTETKEIKEYLRIFPDIDKDFMVEELTKALTTLHDKNPLGVRLLTSLTHQFFINGGLDYDEVMRCSLH